VRKVLGMFPFGIGEAKAFLAALAAAAVGLGVRQWHGGLGTLAVGALALGATYLLIVTALGITDDDRLVLDELRRRRSVAAP
jgi:hypothetical protein